MLDDQNGCSLCSRRMGTIPDNVQRAPARNVRQILAVYFRRFRYGFRRIQNIILIQR